MTRMHRKLVLITFIILMFLGNFSLYPNPVNPAKEGLDKFIEYLNTQKETLGYKNYGSLEHTDHVEIRIYCTEETVGKILTETEKFDYHKLTIGRASDDNVTVVVTFLKPGVEPPAEPSEVTRESKLEEGKEAKPAKCPKKVKVQVEPVTTKIFMEYKYYEKPVAPAKEFEVLAPAEEKIAEVLVNQGDMVSANQVLIRYEANKINKEISIAKAELKKWQQNLFKYEHWKVRNPDAETKAKNEIKKAEARLAENEELLKRLEIRTPENGQVVFIANKETAVPKGGVAAKVINPLVMKIDLPADDGYLFTDDERIIIAFKEVGLSLIGKVEKKADSLRILVDNSNLRLSEGAVARFRVLLKKHEKAVVIASKMLLEDAKGKYVYIVDNEKFAKKAYLDLGPLEEGDILVRSGLSPENRIITTGIECLEDGKKIKILTKLPAPKKEEVITPKPVKEEKVKKEGKAKKEEITDTDRHVLKLGFGVGYYMIGDDVFKDVYGSSLMSGYLSLSYSFSSTLEMYLAAAIISKKGTFTEFADEVTLSMYPVYFGAKYKFSASPKLKPYVGGALTIYNVKEKTSTVSVPYKTKYGASLNGGTTLNFSPKLGLFVDLKYDLVKIPVEEIDSDLDLSGLRLTLGLTYTIKF